MFSLTRSLLLFALTTPTWAVDFLPPEPLAKAGFETSWRLTLPLDPDQYLVSAYLVDDQLYFCTQDGWTLAVEANTGVLRWNRQVTDRGYFVEAPVHLGDQAIFATPGRVTAFHRVLGDGIARRELDFAAATPPVADGRRYYLAGRDRRLYAFDPNDHRVVWQILTPGAVAGGLELRDGTLYAVTTIGQLIAVNVDGDEPRLTWARGSKTPADVMAGIGIDDERVFVAGRDWALWAYRRSGGQVLWRARLGGPLYDTPVSVADRVLQFSPTEGLVALDSLSADDMTLYAWRWPTGRQVLTRLDDRLLVKSIDGVIDVLDLATGASLNKIPAYGFNIGVTSVTEPVIYLADENGRLVCARRRGAPLPTPSDLFNAVLPADLRDTVAVPDRTPGAGAALDADDDGAVDPLSRPQPLGGRSRVTRELVGGE